MNILFLDDMPSRVPLIQPHDRISYVRNFEQFRTYLLNFPLPDIISFDHDLSDEHYTSNGGYNEPYREATGTDCAKWALKHGFVPECVIIHSYNQEGARRISAVFENNPNVKLISIRPFNSREQHILGVMRAIKGQ